MAGGFNTSDASVVLLFKKKYMKYLENVFNRTNPTLGKIKVMNDVVGEELQKAVDLGWIGGAGASRLPQANRGKYVRATLSTKKLYITAEIDRRTMKLSKDPGAFVEAQKHTVKKVAEKYQWLRSFALWSPAGDGKIATVDSGGVTDNGGGEYELVCSSTTYHRARVCVRDIVNIESGNTDPFEITAVDHANRTITVQRLSGSQVPAATDEIFLQNSEDEMPYSIPQVLNASSGSLYGVDVQDGWESYKIAAASSGISVDILNQLMLGVHEQCGVSPDMLVTGYTQMRKLLNLIEDQKRYFVEGATSKNRKGDFSFSGVQFMSIDGPVNIFLDRFVEDDKFYALNSDYIEEHNTEEGAGWVDEDGTIWVRKQGADEFEARYAGYTNNLIIPNFHGQVTGLAT